MEKMVNCSLHALEEAYLMNDNWKSIISYHNNVRIPEQRPYIPDDDFEQPTSIWAIMERDGINIHDRESLPRDIVESPGKALDYAKDLFILEPYAKADDAESLSREVGVVAFPTIDTDLRPITKHGTLNLNQESVFTWEEFLLELNDEPRTPSNALIFIDRYLFGQDGPVDGASGLNNIFHILDSLLPPQLDGSYDLLFIFNKLYFRQEPGMPGAVIEESIKEEIASINNSVRAIIDKLNRPFTVNIELVRVTNDSPIIQLTHNRKIISNYFIIKGDYGLKPFIGPEANQAARDDHNLSFDCIYAGIENPYQRRRGLPVQEFDNMLKQLSSYFRDSTKNEKQYIYVCNGSFDKDIKEIKNRLLK